MSFPRRHTGRLPIALGILLLLAAAPASRMPLAAQAPAPGGRALPAAYLQGYVKALSGDVLVYPWAYPGQVETLLSRTTDGRMAVEWEGQPVPPGPPDEVITYLWHAGTASGYGAHAFTLSVNGTPCATFRSGRTAADLEWAVAGAGGSRLEFKTTRVGTFNELFGFMWLTAPRMLFGSGAPRFRVVGEAAGNQDYYLGQKARAEAWVRVRPEEAVLTGGRRAVRLEFSTIGPSRPAALLSGTETLWSGEARPGYASALVPAGPNRAATLPLRVEVGGKPVLTQTLQLAPVRIREIHLLPHSHVDIGYSDPQPEVERKQWKNLRDAVDLARKTAAYPVEARFKWNVEGLWSVESYLKQASSADRQAFVDAVKAGSIGMQANYTNVLTGLMTPEELRHWTDAARQLQAVYGFGPMRSAMHSDIPGVSWTVVAALAQAGVRYFSSGPNYMPGFPDLGDRIGGTIRALGDKPFWWVSPSGEQRLLFWAAGHGYSWFHGLNTGRMSDASRDTVLDYVRDLAANGYRWDLIQARYTVGGDNGPTDPDLPDVVKRWNEQFESPRLVINTTEALFAELERRHGAELPVMRGDMTPYWEDGAVSTAAEEAMVRASARRLTQAEALFALRVPGAYPSTALAEAWRNVLLWREHTWGAADSISQPDRADVVAQWEYKRAFAVQADSLSRKLMDAATTGSGTAIDIVNTLGWARGGLVMLPASRSRGGDRVHTIQGRPVLSQRLADGRLAVWLDDVPAFASVRLTIEAGQPFAPVRPLSAMDTTLDTGSLRLDIDRATGAVARLAWRGRTDIRLGAGLFDYLYVPGRNPAEAQRVSKVSVRLEDRGPLVATLRVESDAPGANALVRSLQVVAGSDQVFVTADLDKRQVRSKESAHLAFPLALPGGVVRFDQGEAIVEPGRNQLPGSCRDFFGVESAFDVSGAASGVSVASLDAPLIELGAITDERQGPGGVRAWRDRVAPGTTLYAYLLNNYWHTNYKADQEGPVRFRFVLQPHGAFDAVALRRFSDEQDQPLVAIAAGTGDAPTSAPFTVSGPGVTASVVDVAAGGNVLLIRVFNPGPVAATARIVPASAAARLFLANAEGSSWAPTGGTLTLTPGAARTLRLELRPRPAK